MICKERPPQLSVHQSTNLYGICQTGTHELIDRTQRLLIGNELTACKAVTNFAFKGYYGLGSS